MYVSPQVQAVSLSPEDITTKLSLHRKFGKQIQKRQLEVPEYAASFVNYKALKKLIKKLSATPIILAQNDLHRSAPVLDSQAALQANKATFFFQLERELEKVNAFYLQKEAELKIRLKTLLDKKKVLQSRSQNTSRRSAKFTTLEEGFQQFGNDLNKLQQFVEINGLAFSKILKKWDKTSKSKTKELYLSRAVEVQPFFDATAISELSDQATTSLQELGAWSEGDNVNFERSQEHIVSSQHLLGTDEGDADTLLLEAVISGNLDSLKDLLQRMNSAAGPNGTRDLALMERITRTFLAAINEGPSNHCNCFWIPAWLMSIPQHLVARSGQTPQLLLLLKSYGADLNQIDKLYSWTPLFHAASEGNVPYLSAMYYAAWEGYLECMRLLSLIPQPPTGGKAIAVPVIGSTMGSSAPMPMSIDADGIPDLELPPPIIPLRRYGHNFLDTKTFIQISFAEENGEQPMIFFHGSKYPAARLTISSKLSDLIPKNILLPFQEDTRLVSFQIDNLDSFAIDFDVFPTYGAKVIAKTVALPSTFRALEICRLTYAQFLSAGSGQNKSSRDLSALPGMPLANITEIHDILAASTVSLEDALSLLPKGMHVNLQILYPTLEEENVMQLSPTVNINAFGDAILKVVFDHARTLREQSPDAMRSIVFSSYNHTICTTLNWKQPNYPVFLCNDLGREWEAGQQLGVEISGRRTTSIKESVRVAKSNNFMGLICCSRLLDMVPALIEAIKSQGLVLVIDKSAEPVDERRLFSDPFPRLPDGVDGVLKANGVLRFNESIDM
ncbi:ankyrin repeat protein nuc-2 [Botrytis cinerea]